MSAGADMRVRLGGMAHACAVQGSVVSVAGLCCDSSRGATLDSNQMTGIMAEGGMNR